MPAKAVISSQILLCIPFIPHVDKTYMQFGVCIYSVLLIKYFKHHTLNYDVDK